MSRDSIFSFVSFLISICLTSTPSLFAQQDAIGMFKRYSIKDGLLNNSIYSLHQSGNGTWWVGTGSGLQRFDGYTFEGWNDVNDSINSKLSASQNVYEDSLGNVWVINFSEHYVIPAGHRKLKPVKIDSTNQIPYPKGYPAPVLEDSVHLWCFAAKEGFFGFNKHTLLIDTLIALGFRTESVALPSVSRYENRSAWVTLDDEDSSYVARFIRGEKIKHYVLPGKTVGRVKGIIDLDHDEILFISTRYTAICRADEPGKPIKILSTENVPGNFVRGMPYTRMRVNNPGGILFAGERGLYEFNPNQRLLRAYSTQAYPEINLSRQLMFALQEDNWGNIWIGRDASDGLLIYYPGKLKFELLKAPREHFNLVYSLAVTRTGQVIAGNFQKGLNVFDESGVWQRHLTLPNSENGLSPTIRTINWFSEDQFLMKSLYDKLMILNTSDYTITDLSSKMPASIRKSSSIFDANIFFIKNNEAHFVHGEFIVSVMKDAAGFQVSVIDTIPQIGQITSIGYLKDGHRIAGTAQGIYQKDDQWHVIEGTENFSVKYIAVDSVGNIWATGSRGICVVEKDRSVRFFNEANGLLNEFVYGILFDDLGNAWYSSNRGLGCIHPDGSISFFTEADGLQGDEFDTQGFWKGTDGKLYFGGINGISAFYPKEVLRKYNPGSVVLSNIQVNGIDYPQQGRVEDLQKVELAYDENSIGFQFAFTNFTDPDYNVYKVLLEGHDEHWVNLRNSRSIQYSLNPGTYTLRIKGSSDGTIWSEELMLPILIHAAWWQTRLFRWTLVFAVLFSFGMGVWYINKIKTHRLMRQLQLEKGMQKERERISRDLHDHIGAYSTALIANADLLEPYILDEKARRVVYYLKENSRNILNTLRETIWLLNTHNLTVSGFYEGFINYCTNILRNHEGIEIEFRDEILRNEMLQPATAIHLLRILQEVIQNIVKHAHATRIEFSFNCGEELRIEVRDNGRGFNSAEIKHMNGLNNIKSRALEIKFRCEITSVPGAGTRVILIGQV